MLIVSGVIEVNPDGAEAARAAIAEVMAETAKEDGCILYEFGQIVGQPARFRVYEEWRDRDALRAHFDTPHMAVFRSRLAEIGLVSRAVQTIEGGEIQPL